MRVHAARSQHGLTYKMAPLEGKRARVLIALMSRAPAAHVPYQKLQVLIWEIEGGLSYQELSAESKLLVDQLIPDLKSQIREDFLQTFQRSKGICNLLGKNIPGLCKPNPEVDALTQRYQSMRQTLLQYANNYKVLSQQIVNIVPGYAENAGPTTWSELSPRVYARLTGGKYYGEIGILELRILPSRDLANETAEVPLQAMLAYPNDVTMQGLGWTPVSPWGLLIVVELTNLEPYLPVLNKIQNALLWFDCNAVTSKTGLGVYFIQVLGDQIYPASRQITQWLPAGVDVADLIAEGMDAFNPGALLADVIEPTLMPEFGLSCDKYNLIDTLIEAARSSKKSGLATAQSDPFTSHTILPDSLKYGPGTIAFRESFRGPVQSVTGSVRLRFVPCQSSEIPQCAKLQSLPSPATSESILPKDKRGRMPDHSAGIFLTLEVAPNSVGSRQQATAFGVVRDAQARPVAGFQVLLFASTDDYATVWQRLTTDRNGAFKFIFTAPDSPGPMTIMAKLESSVPEVAATATVTVRSASPAEIKGGVSSQQGHSATQPRRSSLNHGIRSVDFLNFDYHSADGETFHVSDGQWKQQTTGQEPGNYFRIVKTAYGDLTGDGGEEAVVLTAYGGTANFELSEIFVFTMARTGPTVLADLSLPHHPERGQEVNWAAVTDAQITARQLLISYLDGESHACPDWMVVASFRWNGNNFVRSGSTRRRYHCR